MIITDVKTKALEIVDHIRALDAGAPVDYIDGLMINTADYLEHLINHPKIKTLAVVGFYDEDREDALDALLGKDRKSDNTYNYSHPYTHDLHLEVSEWLDDAPYTVALAPHRTGDVRGNYEDIIIFRFQDPYDYYEILDDYIYEHASKVVEVDGVEYSVYWSGGGEYYYLQSENHNSDGLVLSGYTLEDVKQDIREYLSRGA